MQDQAQLQTPEALSSSLGHSPRTFRVHLTIPRFFHLLTAKLAVCYDRLQEMNRIPKRTYQEFVVATCSRVTSEAVEPIQIVIQALEGGEGIKEEKRVMNSPLGPIAVALIFAIRGDQLLKRGGSSDIAWSYITDAAYWTSAAVGGMKFQDIQWTQLSQGGTKGGVNRALKYDELKARVLELVKNHPAKPSKGWPSPDFFCGTIWHDIEDLTSPSKLNLPVKESTVLGWIRSSKGYGAHFHPSSAMAKKDKKLQSKASGQA
jgi:hypothetical protein